MICGVLGAGAWGAALADRLARNSHEVRIWAYEPDVVDSINNTHTNRFLAGVTLTPSIVAASEVREVVSGADVVVLVAPSHVTRAVAEAAQPHIAHGALVVVASKGIEQHSFARMTQVAESVFGRESAVALSGPTFALEVARGQPTAIVAACAHREPAELAQQIFHAPAFRVYTQHDVVGVELGGAVKNVMALATGIAEGLELGYNARAALITRGLAEMTRLGVALGADPATFAGLAGMGDLVLTCTGQLSRNRALGVEIGRGKTLDEALVGRDTIAEGVITTRSTKALAERVGVSMPIVDGVFSVLFDGQKPRDAIVELMNRDPRPERDE
ncbi:MAG: NAD(P)H-dependent glycerol-3-phosphate dehydrogenase [Gemmatimonadaceae bacterium]